MTALRRPHLRDRLRPGADVTARYDQHHAPATGEKEKTARRGLVEPARATLQRTVREAAALATDTTDFLNRLRDAGLRAREHHDENGTVDGYAVAPPGDRADHGSRPVWFSGRTLAYDLSPPRRRTLRTRHHPRRHHPRTPPHPRSSRPPDPRRTHAGCRRHHRPGRPPHRRRRDVPSRTRQGPHRGHRLRACLPGPARAPAVGSPQRRLGVRRSGPPGGVLSECGDAPLESPASPHRSTRPWPPALVHFWPRSAPRASTAPRPARPTTGSLRSWWLRCWPGRSPRHAVRRTGTLTQSQPLLADSSPTERHDRPGDLVLHISASGWKNSL